jgi:hypothetical protein
MLVLLTLRYLGSSRYAYMSVLLTAAEVDNAVMLCSVWFSTVFDDVTNSSLFNMFFE